MARPENRVPKFGATPPAKGARPGANPESANAKNPVWSVLIFDVEGPWGRKRLEESGALWESVFPKLRQYESMTWAEIIGNKKRDHSVTVAGLIKEARDRLTYLNLDDIDELFRFRLSGLERIWGIRDREVFRLLWWDPEHEIYPSTLKNT